MPHLGKYLRTIGMAVLPGALFFSSCAHRDKAPTAPPIPVAGTHVLNPAKTRGVTPVSLEAPLPEAEVPYTGVVAQSQPLSKTEQIARLVNQGFLVDSSRNLLIFAKSRTAKPPASSLYEDAILLGKLRRNLAAAKLPAGFPNETTVTDAVACLKMDGAQSPEIAARAIDAALKTPGISAVKAQLSAAARL